MARMITTDHEAIRSWILEQGGIPILLRDESGESEASVLSLQFSDTPLGIPIGWNEFFTQFETEQLAFAYDPDAPREAASSTYTFVSREKRVGAMPERENTEMPEDRPEMNENLHPSHD